MLLIQSFSSSVRWLSSLSLALSCVPLSGCVSVSTETVIFFNQSLELSNHILHLPIAPPFVFLALMEDLGQIELNPMAFKMLLIESVVVFRTLLVTGQPEYSDELVWNPLRLGGVLQPTAIIGSLASTLLNCNFSFADMLESGRLLNNILFCSVRKLSTFGISA